MPPKNRTKRKHAPDRRERREAFFSESKTTRGEWAAQRQLGKKLAPGRKYNPLTKCFAAPFGAENRVERRALEQERRQNVRRYQRGRWVQELACAIRGFVRRHQIYEYSDIEVTIDGVRLEGIKSISYTDSGNLR